MVSGLPGFNTPAVGFGQPFEMLEACHERVQRTLTLLEKLRAYLHTHRCDDTARQAARDVLRYFDLAAPLHHQDEELHIFPLLLAQGRPDVVAPVQQLQHDHHAMEADWAAARGPLQALAEGEIQTFSGADEAVLAQFSGRYADHIRVEEGLAYPAAQALLSASAVAAMGQEMAQRRGAR